MVPVGPNALANMDTHPLVGERLPNICSPFLDPHTASQIDNQWASCSQTDSGRVMPDKPITTRETCSSEGFSQVADFIRNGDGYGHAT